MNRINCIISAESENNLINKPKLSANSNFKINLIPYLRKRKTEMLDLEKDEGATESPEKILVDSPSQPTENHADNPLHIIPEENDEGDTSSTS